ncbi:uncharacterized protein PV09_01750 [Verruconis gallopava]|uniref:Metallo-beta-lactamase domain-containing protein n=1 Tax=Verruconis gallopava TaxID=253628 RepID=A0A0D1Z4E3_9PEZI|nr:uncharacterized protein PV09_01750 [Verruconis gallopava]KIW07832.1 hypothetical protein PV09_01750 [Verruconis gallopava]
MANSDDLAICVACGTQYDAPFTDPPKSCKICDDPRQYVPPTGQQWSCLSKLKADNFKNTWTQDAVDPRVWFIQSVPDSLPAHLAGVNLGLTSGMKVPKIGIGQRAILLQTEHGNVLWDLVPFINDKFVEEVKQKGGIKAIVISHPHFYNTHLDWAAAFDCPVYLAFEDKEWLCRLDDDEKKPRRRFITTPTLEIVPGVTAIKAGGHFPGSLLLHWDKKLFIADTIMTVPSGLYFQETRQPKTNVYSFMWSYPNMIPLRPSDVTRIWKAVAPFQFETTHGGFPGQDVRRADLKTQLLESMKNWVESVGATNEEIFTFTWP